MTGPRVWLCRQIQHTLAKIRTEVPPWQQVKIVLGRLILMNFFHFKFRTVRCLSVYRQLKQLCKVSVWRCPQKHLFGKFLKRYKAQKAIFPAFSWLVSIWRALLFYRPNFAGLHKGKDTLSKFSFHGISWNTISGWFHGTWNNFTKYFYFSTQHSLRTFFINKKLCLQRKYIV